ncbi:MAG: sigma factor, partial [Verrucomicrobiota bacterium]
MSQEHEWLQAGYRYAVSLTHHHQDAEDLVQKAWLKIISGRRKIRTRSFLFKTIRNLFIDQIRRANIIQFDSLEEDNREVMVEDSSCASSR